MGVVAGVKAPVEVVAVAVSANLPLAAVEVPVAIVGLLAVVAVAVETNIARVTRKRKIFIRKE